MNRHFRAYAEAYFVGMLFVLLQLCLAFLTTSKLYPAAVRQSMTGFDWMIFLAMVLATCLPTIIAFLNGAVQRGRAKQDSLPLDVPGLASDLPSWDASYVPPRPGQLAMDPKIQDAVDQLRSGMKPKIGGPIVNTAVTPEEIAAARPDIATGPVVHDPTPSGNESSPLSESVKVDPPSPDK